MDEDLEFLFSDEPPIEPDNSEFHVGNEADEPTLSDDEEEGEIEKLKEEEILGKVKATLQFMSDQGLDVALFLDAFCWGDKGCHSDPTVQFACTGLMVSNELPGILRRGMGTITIIPLFMITLQVTSPPVTGTQDMAVGMLYETCSWPELVNNISLLTVPWKTRNAGLLEKPMSVQKEKCTSGDVSRMAVGIKNTFSSVANRVERSMSGWSSGAVRGAMLAGGMGMVSLVRSAASAARRAQTRFVGEEAPTRPVSFMGDWREVEAVAASAMHSTAIRRMLVLMAAEPAMVSDGDVNAVVAVEMSGGSMAMREERSRAARGSGVPHNGRPKDARQDSNLQQQNPTEVPSGYTIEEAIRVRRVCGDGVGMFRAWVIVWDTQERCQECPGLSSIPWIAVEELQDKNHNHVTCQTHPNFGDVSTVSRPFNSYLMVH
ncbi:hypothetical protein C8J57DRAFT_1251291 [Mycena rebaudengoi]|nr:hypothetical protein C8J57DRAFT_1251291 [Mycena rebaudengoi]